MESVHYSLYYTVYVGGVHVKARAGGSADCQIGRGPSTQFHFLRLVGVLYC